MGPKDLKQETTKTKKAKTDKSIESSILTIFDLLTLHAMAEEAHTQVVSTASSLPDSEVTKISFNFTFVPCLIGD